MALFDPHLQQRSLGRSQDLASTQGRSLLLAPLNNHICTSFSFKLEVNTNHTQVKYTNQREPRLILSSSIDPLGGVLTPPKRSVQGQRSILLNPLNQHVGPHLASDWRPISITPLSSTEETAMFDSETHYRPRGVKSLQVHIIPLIFRTNIHRHHSALNDVHYFCRKKYTVQAVQVPSGKFHGVTLTIGFQLEIKL